MSNARKWTRLPGDAVGNSAIVKRAGHVNLVAQVVDESVDGLAILVTQRADISVGEVLQISLGDHDRDGVVCHVAQAGLRLRVGIRFEASREPRQCQDASAEA